MSQLTSRGLDNTSSAFVSDIYIFGCWQAPEPSWHIRILFSWSLSKSRFLPHQKILFLSKVIAVLRSRTPVTRASPYIYVLRCKRRYTYRYTYIRLKTKKKIWFNCLRDVNASEYLDSSSWKQMICKGSLHDFMRDLHDFV